MDTRKGGPLQTSFPRHREQGNVTPDQARTSDPLPRLLDRPLNATPQKAGTEAPVLSAEPGYASYVSQQIQSIARVSQRMWRANYGQNHLPAGVGGEGNGAFMRLQYADLRPDGSLGPWVNAFACVPRAGTKVAVLDPHLCAMPDGSLLITMPTSGVKGRAAWACVLDNPLADTGWKLGPFCFLGGGAFVGRPRILHGQVHMTLNVPVNGIRDVPSWQGAKLIRLAFEDGMVRFDHLSTIPFVEPRLETSSYQETSLVPFGEAGIMAFFRTKKGQFTSIDHRGDGAWTAPQPLPFRTIPARYDAARSPSGRIVYAGNGPMAKGRSHMSVRLSEDGAAWPEETFGMLFASVSSYPSVEFGADAAGAYNGLVYVAFDHGRGTIRNPANRDAYLNGLPIAVLREDDLAAGRAEILHLDMTTS